MAKSRPPTCATPDRRYRWTAERARTILAELASSGLSVPEFAARHGLDSQRVYRWRHRLGERPATLVPTVRFAEVLIGRAGKVVGSRAGQPGGERFEVELRGGTIVRVGPSFDADALRRLLRVLNEGEARC